MKSTDSKLVLMGACVCCGYESQTSKSKAICRVCRWENDGSDNASAYRYSRANRTNLNLARFEYLRQNVKISGKQIRFFSIDETSCFIEERSANGKLVYQGPIPFVEYAIHGKGIVAAVPITKAVVRKPRRSA